ncbi:MAG: hypothetical protein J5613_02825, partial [Alphaproteobacteria bacterium]|nr:hypothetical protein [Alphaproteobacteria bacterium]
TLTDDMRNWVRDYLQHQDPNNPNSPLSVDGDGNYIPNALPNDLSDEDARKLFITFQQAFAGMHADLSSFQDTDHQSADFVNNYFGPGKLFKISPATRDCATGIEAILNLLNSHPNLKDYIVKNTQKSDGKPVFESVANLDQLLGKCDSAHKEYDTNNSIQKKIQSVARTLEGVVGFGWYSSIDRDSEEYRAINGIKDQIANVTSDDAFAMNPANIDAVSLANFRSIYLGGAHTADNQGGLLQTLYFNKTIRNRFAKYDNGTITGPIEKAEESVNWQDKSKGNYVDPKIDDVLTPYQRLQEWFSDTYDDAFKKYEELRGGHNFFKQEAKDIFKAIDKEKVKPVDGLKGLLDKKSGIEGRLNNPVAREHFKWFVETMEPIAAKMPKAIEGAWKDAKQMRAIVSQIILRATDPRNDDPHAMEKAKTAMEIMTAMKYGMLTSKVMDAIKSDKELFSVFSNEKLSWNKYEGVQFVTKAFDKTVRAAFLGVGYGVTIVKNKIKLSGRKYRHRHNSLPGALAERYRQEDANGRQALENQNAADEATRRQRRQELRNLNTGPNPINGQNVANMENNVLPRLNRTMQGAQGARDQAQQDFDRISGQTQEARDRLQADRQYGQRHGNLLREIDNANQEITRLENEISQLGTTPVDDARRQMLTQQLQEQLRIHDEKSQELTDLDATHNAYIGANGQKTQDEQAEYQYNQAQAGLTTAQDAADTAKQEHDNLSDRIQQYKDATAEVQELDRAIADREQALQNWPQQNTNRVAELEKYWNFLQDNSTTWGLSQKRSQKRFDRNKQRMWQDYISQHGI